MKLTPAPPTFFDTAPQQISTEVEVGAPLEDVWAALTDHQSWKHWFPGFTEVTASPANWTAAGDTRQVVINRLRVDEECIIFEPEADFAFTILEWPLPIARMAAERVQLVDTSRQGEERTNLIYSAAFDCNAFGRLVFGQLEPRLVGGWGQAFEQLHLHLQSSTR